MTAKLRELEGRLKQLPPEPEADEISIDAPPNAVELYRQKVASPREALDADDLTRDEATAVLRGLIEKTVVYPEEKRGMFDLERHGHLAAILNIEKHGNVGGGRGTGFETFSNNPYSLWLRQAVATMLRS